ncbi:MAG: flagellar protein FliT [Gammaproteobacteria bacterium]|nr:MAG: flagellar protein FliT [Gammaproteobacteria bacterium]
MTGGVGGPGPEADGPQRLLTLTGGMLGAARRGDWAALEALERERRPLLRALTEAVARRAPGAAAVARAVLDMDQETVALAARAREETLRALEGLHAGQRAVQAYGEGGAGG